MRYVICALIGYILGNVQPSILISTKVKQQDVRQLGSGNAGATNMLRSFGWGMGVLTFLLDVIKGALAYIIGGLIAPETGAVVGGIAVVLGHNWPAIYKFKGGKGIACSMGIMLAVDWRIALVIFLCAALIVALTKYVSAGSLLIITMFFLYSLVVMPVPIKILASVLFVLGYFKHWGNITRLIKGEEPTLSSRNKIK